LGQKNGKKELTMQSSKPKLLVTGASGFLGACICKIAHEQGYEVYGSVRSVSSRESIDFPWLNILVLNLSDETAVSKVLQNKDYVIHCAGVMSTTSRNEEDSRRTNIELTRIIARQSIKAGIKRFVFASSLAAGGPGAEALKARKETDPDRPVSHYGRSKLDAENMLKTFSNELSVVSLRFSTIYGPRDCNIFGFFKLISGKFVPLVGGKKTVYNSMVYVEDAARAALCALKAKVVSGSVYQITDGQVYSFSSLYDYVEDAVGKKKRGKRINLPFWIVMLKAWWLHDVLHKRGISPDQVRQMKARYWFASPEKAIKELGWRPQMDMKNGLKKTVQWYKNEGWLQ